MMNEYQEYIIQIYVRVYKNRTEYRNKEGQLHRDGDLPAIEWNDGRKDWYQNGVHHREGAPAIEFNNGIGYWYINGRYHCESGPAVADLNGWKDYWLNGINYSEVEFNDMIYSKTYFGKTFK